METTKPTIEDLLKPRFKVIADYPNQCHLKDHIVDDLFYDDEYKDEEWFAKYPAIFRRMDWYEGRHIGEMPEYAKLYRGHGPNPYYRHIHVDGAQVKWNFLGDKCVGISYKSGGHNTVEILEPSTEQDFLNYQASQP